MGKYVEPAGYFTKEMKKVLEKGKSENGKKATSTKATKKPAPKKSK